MTRAPFWGLAAGLGLLLLLAACGGAVDAGSTRVEGATANCETPPPPPSPGTCWLTGGGTKFDSVTRSYVAEHGPKINFAGNVNPSCSPYPGDGGQWNHVDHDLKLHFQGTAITVDACFPIAEIGGSESPVTPYNVILFHGTGWVQGIGGNKLERTPACFVARAEDRAEPGSKGQRTRLYVDRYFIEITDCDDGGLFEPFGLGTPGEPQPVTTGNLQIHVSSCDAPP
jgi:hypothetical protein